MADEFKGLVRDYVAMHDQIAGMARDLAAVRKKKDALGDLIVLYMKKKDIHVIELTEHGGKLVRRQATRSEALKKEHIIAELMTLTGNDASRAQTALDNIYAKRARSVRDSLSRTQR